MCGMTQYGVRAHREIVIPGIWGLLPYLDENRSTRRFLYIPPESYRKWRKEIVGTYKLRGIVRVVKLTPKGTAALCQHRLQYYA